MSEFKVTFKTLTPLWTGDAERKNTKLRETGIIGSLRWWYEALIRGLGGSVCDPTSDNKCKLNQEKFKKALRKGKPIQDALSEQICPVCQLFGCTGWARKFRLEIESINLAVIPEIKIGTREKRVIKGKERYLIRNAKGFMADGSIVLKFIPLRKISSNEWALLNKTLKIIADYGAFGSHTSQGNGVIQIVENHLPYRDEKFEKSELKGKGNNINFPNLDNFFFYKFQIKFTKNISELIDEEIFWIHSSDHNSFQDDWGNWKKLWNNYHFLPIAFHIRDTIRHLDGNRTRRHATFGTGGRNAQGSRVFVSHGHRISNVTVEIRIWGYDVEESIKNKIKEELENKLKEKLFSKGEYKGSLEICTLTEEKTGKEILKGLK